MKFEEAMELMRNGESVRRKGWYIRIHYSKYEFVNDTGHEVILSPNDLIKTDWEVWDGQD